MNNKIQPSKKNDIEQREFQSPEEKDHLAIDEALKKLDDKISHMSDKEKKDFKDKTGIH
jgi:hypothetical protein